MVVTLHAEGLLAQPSLLAALRNKRVAANAGIAVELVLVMDSPSAQTRQVVNGFPQGTFDQVMELEAGDVGTARNAAIRQARGHRIAICDGDDFLSAGFVVDASRMLDMHGGTSIMRPELVVHFDRQRFVGWQSGSEEEGFDPDCMLVINPWTSASMAERDVYLQCVYWEGGGLDAGFGFEDWHWNCETLARKFKHIVVPKTVHYVRLKSSGSLNSSNIEKAVIVPASSLFDHKP